MNFHFFILQCEPKIISHESHSSSYTSYSPSDHHFSHTDHGSTFINNHPIGAQHGLIVPTATIVHHEHTHTHIQNLTPVHQQPINNHNQHHHVSPVHHQQHFTPIHQPSNTPLHSSHNCQCVPRHYCDEEYVVASHNPHDFSAAISPRTRNSNITSNATDNSNAASSDIEGRLSPSENNTNLHEREKVRKQLEKLRYISNSLNFLNRSPNEFYSIFL